MAGEGQVRGMTGKAGYYSAGGSGWNCNDMSVSRWQRKTEQTTE